MGIKLAAFDHLGEHKDFDNETTPPIDYECEEETEAESSLIAQVKIDASFIRFSFPEIYVDKLEQKQKCLIIIKRPHLRRDFKAEREMLYACNAARSLHIVNLLASFTWQEIGYLILPPAKTDLWNFWLIGSSSSQLTLSPSSAEKWTLIQLHGLGSALSTIHTKLSTDNGIPVFGLHGDIKATNVLLFPSSSYYGPGPGVLQLGDMGSSALFSSLSAASQIPPSGSSGTHSPPESILETPYSQALDIWSMGCLILEYLIWLLKGPQGLESFIEERTQVSYPFGLRFTNDFFFKLEPSEDKSDSKEQDSRPMVTALNPGVISCIAKLRDECTPVLRQLLEIVEGDLLQIDQTKRISAEALEDKLQQLLNGYVNGHDSG